MSHLERPPGRTTPLACVIRALRLSALVLAGLVLHAGPGRAAGGSQEVDLGTPEQPRGHADPPPGHYLSFARQRDLDRELVRVLEEPGRTGSDFATDRALRLDRAFRTPGVRGFWMAFDWAAVEVKDGVYDWRAIDTNMDVARRYGLQMIVKIGDRSFDGTAILPAYFPAQYVLQSKGRGNGGVVARRWHPYVYDRQIRLYRRIAQRYRSHPAFGGIATSETAIGAIDGDDYTAAAYEAALVRVASETQQFLTRGRLFFYLNFVKGGQRLDMNQDARVRILQQIPRHAIVIGAPDLTPDADGMPGSVNAYRIHARRTMPELPQFCHLQHVDQGLRGLNVKTNEHRDAYRRRVDRVRDHEDAVGFSGRQGAYPFDELRDADGRAVDRHPDAETGEAWQLDELLAFGRRNFGCDYVLWHFREHPAAGEFGWSDVRAAIMDETWN